MPTIISNTDLKQMYFSIEEGLKQVKQGKIKPMRESLKSIRTYFK